jgi:hypothetical protein
VLIHCIEALKVEGFGVLTEIDVQKAFKEKVSSGTVEISAVNPVESMKAISNVALAEIAIEVRARLQRVIEQL